MGDAKEEFFKIFYLVIYQYLKITYNIPISEDFVLSIFTSHNHYYSEIYVISDFLITLNTCRTIN